jgi:hypothetical protein
MLQMLHQYTLPAAYDVLPPKMQSTQATAMLLAIALQESKCAYRYQLPRKAGGKPGPARGFWQFEAGGGVKGVLKHRATTAHARRSLVALAYPGNLTTVQIHAILEHNDVLAAVFARLLLWTLPERLCGPGENAKAWQQYLMAWAPGEPHPETWEGYYRRAWSLVAGGMQTE